MDNLIDISKNLNFISTPVKLPRLKELTDDDVDQINASFEDFNNNKTTQIVVSDENFEEDCENSKTFKHLKGESIRKQQSRKRKIMKFVDEPEKPKRKKAKENSSSTTALKKSKIT